MRIAMNITNEPLDVSSDSFIEQLDERIGAGVGNTDVNVTHVINSNGGGHVHIAPVNGGTSLDVDDSKIIQETFVLNMDGLRIEMVADVNGVTRSLLFHARATALTRDDVQKAYDLVYNIADGHDAISGRDLLVLELIDKNDFFESDADNVDEEELPQSAADDNAISTSAYESLLGMNTASNATQSQVTQNSQYNVAAPMGISTTNKDNVSMKTSGTMSMNNNSGYDGIPSDILGMLLGDESEGNNKSMETSYDEQYGTNAWGMGANVTGWNASPASRVQSNGNGATEPESSSFGVSDMQKAMNDFMQQLGKTNNAAKAEVEKLREKLTNQYVVNEQLRKSLNAEIDDKAKLQEEASQHAEEIAKREAKVRSLQEALSSAIEARDDAQKQLQDANARYDRLNSETSKKLSSFNDVLSAVRAQLSSEKDKTSEQQASIKQLGSIISGHESTIDGLRTQLQKSAEEKQSLNESVSNLRKQHESDRASIAKKYEKQIADAIAQADEEHKSAIAAKADASKSLKEFADKTLVQLKARQTKYDEDTASLEGQVTSLTKLLDDVTNDRDSIRKQVTTLSRNSITMKDRLAKADERANTAEASLKNALAENEKHVKAEADYEDAIAHEREIADSAKASALKMTEFAARKYAEAIRTRDECEEIANVMRTAMDRDDTDLSGLRERIALVLRRIDAGKEDDIPELQDAMDDNVSEMHDVNGVFVSEDELADQADDIASSYVEEDVADDTADENIGMIGSPSVSEEQEVEFDDDYSFPSDNVMDGIEEDVIADDELNGTPLANTGSIDGELLMDMMELDDDGDESSAEDTGE